MRTIEVQCQVCGKKFNRYKSEVERSVRLGRRIYCSRSCCGKDNVMNCPKSTPGIRPQHLNPANQLDEFSPFRQLYRSAKRRSEEKREFSLTLENLKCKWEEQKGICPYTGWKMQIHPSTNPDQAIKELPTKASLDRIDSSKGYIPDNIQFVTYMANCAKSFFTEQQLVEFCKAVAERH